MSESVPVVDEFFTAEIVVSSESLSLEELEGTLGRKSISARRRSVGEPIEAMGRTAIESVWRHPLQWPDTVPGGTDGIDQALLQFSGEFADELAGLDRDGCSVVR